MTTNGSGVSTRDTIPMVRPGIIHAISVRMTIILRKHGKRDQMTWMIPGPVSSMPFGVNDHETLRKHGVNDQMTWMIPGPVSSTSSGVNDHKV